MGKEKFESRKSDCNVGISAHLDVSLTPATTTILSRTGGEFICDDQIDAALKEQTRSAESILTDHIRSDATYNVLGNIGDES